jgi:hypothetical protein
MGVLGTIVVAFASAAAGVASNLGLATVNRIEESKSTAAILAAEIAATLSIIRQRRYVEFVKGQIEEPKRGGDPILSDFVQDPSTLDIAYRAAVSGFKLGLVGPNLAGLVTRFYRQFYSLIIDVKRFGDGRPMQPAVKAIYLEEALRIWADAERDAEQAVTGLNAFASRGTFSHLFDSLRGS